MKRFVFSGVFIVAIIAGFAMTISPVVSQLSGSAWPKFMHDNRTTGRSPFAGPTGTPSIAWQTSIDSGGQSSPSVGPDGTIYVSSGKSLWAVASDGTLKWSLLLDQEVSSPAIDTNGAIYVATALPSGSSAKLCKVQDLGTSGSLAWEFALGVDQYGAACNPAIAPDGTIYVTTRPELASPDQGFHCYAINPDGSLKWKWVKGVPDCPGSPIGGAAYGVAIDGSSRIYFTASAVAEGCVYGHTLYSLNPDGTTHWERSIDATSDCVPTISADGSKLYLTHRNGPGDSGVAAYSTNDGSLLWFTATPIADDSQTADIALDSLGDLIVGSNQGIVRKIASSNGAILWTYNFGSSVNIGRHPTVDANGTIYVTANYLIAISSAGSELWRVDLPGDSLDTASIGSDGTLYLRANSFFGADLCAVR